jgi:hypothetical protein
MSLTPKSLRGFTDRHNEITRSSGPTAYVADFCARSDDGLLVYSKNQILQTGYISLPSVQIVSQLRGVVGNVHYRVGAEFALLCICFGKVKSGAFSDQLITFTRCLREALPIKYRDLPSAALNQAGTFQLPGNIGDGWPLDTQHFGEQVLSDRKRVIVAAVTHHEQPTCQSLLEAVRTVARY